MRLVDDGEWAYWDQSSQRSWCQSINQRSQFVSLTIVLDCFLLVLSLFLMSLKDTHKTYRGIDQKVSQKILLFGGNAGVDKFISLASAFFSSFLSTMVYLIHNIIHNIIISSSLMNSSLNCFQCRRTAYSLVKSGFRFSKNADIPCGTK